MNAVPKYFGTDTVHFPTSLHSFFSCAGEQEQCKFPTYTLVFVSSHALSASPLLILSVPVGLGGCCILELFLGFVGFATLSGLDGASEGLIDPIMR